MMAVTALGRTGAQILGALLVAGTVLLGVLPALAVLGSGVGVALWLGLDALAVVWMVTLTRSAAGLHGNQLVTLQIPQGKSPPEREPRGRDAHRTARTIGWVACVLL